jgi:hypothetical protein
MDKELLKQLETKFENVQTALQEAQEKGATKVELQKCIDAVKRQGQALEDFIEAQKEKQIKTIYDQFKSFLLDDKNKAELERIKTSKSGEIKFVPKAVGDISTGNGGDVETVPANMNTSLGNFNLRNDNDMLGLFTVTSTNSPQYAYTEQEPKDGNYAMVAEAGTKPQIDFKWSNRYATPKKAAAHEVLSEESVTDIPRLLSVAKEYLKKQHDLFKVDRCYFGDGLLENPKGATEYGRTFVAGSMATAIATPNFMDVVNACITDIYTTHNFINEASYKANIVLINPVDFFIEFQSAKDGNGLPLYPQASLFNTVTIGGVTIRPWAKIPSGKIFVADATKYNVANYIPFSIRVGWINEQFITNQFTMVGESRFFAFVKNFDQQAFIYDDIATIKTAITAL